MSPTLPSVSVNVNAPNSTELLVRPDFMVAGDGEGFFERFTLESPQSIGGAGGDDAAAPLSGLQATLYGSLEQSASASAGGMPTICSACRSCARVTPPSLAAAAAPSPPRTWS